MTTKVCLGFFKNFEDLTKVEKPKKSNPYLYFIVSFDCEICGKQNQTLGYESILKKGRLECRSCAAKTSAKSSNRKNWKDFSFEKQNEISNKKRKAMLAIWQNSTNEERQKRLAGFKRYLKSESFRPTNAKAKYKFENLFFDSSWELAVYIFLKDNCKDFEFHPKSYFSYEWEGKSHKYFPDFRVGKDFWEIKGPQFIKGDGTWTNPFNPEYEGQMEKKHQLLIEKNVKILTKNEIGFYLDFVKNNYGETFIKKCQRTGDNSEKL